MKFITLFLIFASFNSYAFETGMGPNGPWTQGPLGYTDPLITMQATSIASLIPPAATSALSNMQVQAKKIINDTQEYFQNGEMSVLLANQVDKIMSQNEELSIDEAVTIVLEFAQKRI